MTRGLLGTEGNYYLITESGAYIALENYSIGAFSRSVEFTCVSRDAMYAFVTPSIAYDMRLRSEAFVLGRRVVAFELAGGG